MHALVAGLGVLVMVALAGGDADAADACKAACKSTRKSCLAGARTAYDGARAACDGLDAAGRKTCLAEARAARAAAKRTCKSAFKPCKQACSGGGGGERCDGSTFGDWLATVNGFRALAGLPAVVENPEWSAGAEAHARYCVKEDYVGHSESPTSPFFTEAGLAAAENGNVAGTSDPEVRNAWAVDLWMSGPFHAIGILDPVLATSGHGLWSEADGGDVQSAAVLDVLRGRTGDELAPPYPVPFPGDGRTFPLDRYTGNESPDPLTSCPDYEAPTGPPLLLLAGPPGTSTVIGATQLLRDGSPVEHCVFDGATYVNPDPGTQATARSVLDARATVVVMPREPLRRGSAYDVSLEVNGTVTAWRFTHDCP